MSDDDTFTEEDAMNDGLIKKEMGPKMAGQAKRTSKELWSFFQQACDHMGRDPEEVLGDHVVKALNDEAYADTIFNTDIDMSKVRGDEMSVEDAEFVQEVMEALGVDSEDSSDPIEEYMMNRLESATKSPLSGMKESIGGRNGEADELTAEIKRLRQEVDELKDSSSNEQQDDGGGEESTDRKNIDDVFEQASGDSDDGDDGSEDSEGVEVTDLGADDDEGEVQGDTVEIAEEQEEESGESELVTSKDAESEGDE